MAWELAHSSMPPASKCAKRQPSGWESYTTPFPPFGFEQAGAKFFREAGASYAAMEAEGFPIPVIERNVQFKAPTHYGEFVDVETTMIRVDKPRIRFECKAIGDGKLRTTGHTLHCLLKNGRPTRELPASFPSLNSLERSNRHMENPEETVQIHVKSLDKTVDFPVRSSSPCTSCKGTGIMAKKPCPICCGSGSIMMLDCIRCNGTKQIENGLKCNVCKGEGTISEATAIEFLQARQFCEEFQKNPAKTILVSLACLVALGACSYFISGYLFVDFLMIQSLKVYIPLLLGICAGFFVLEPLHKMHVGSYMPAPKKFMISAVVIALAIAAIAIPGPVAGRYHWMEGEAKEIISEALAGNGLSCRRVKVFGKDGDDYHGIATISDGEEIKMDIHYKNVGGTRRQIRYSIEVEPVE